MTVRISPRLVGLASLAIVGSLVLDEGAARAETPSPMASPTVGRSSPAEGSGARPAPPAPTTAPTRDKITFAKALELARSRAPSLAVARADIERAEALVRQARAASFPTITGNGTYTRLDGDRVVSGRVAQGADSLALNVNLTVPIVSASRWGAWKRAEDTVEVSVAQKSAAERDVLAAAARSYLAVLLQRKALAVAERSRDVAKEHLRVAEAKEKGGLATRLDVVRASQDLEATEGQLAQTRLALVRTEEALGTTLALDAPMDAADEPALDVSAPPELQARSDLQAQARDVRAKDRATQDNVRDYIPTLSASFQPFYQNPPTLTLPETGWQAQLALTVPFYDGGLRYGQQKEREAQLTQARVRYEDSLRRARSEVRVAESAIEEATKVVERTRKSATLAREAAALAQIAYTSGVVNNLELVDADRRARDAEAALAISEDAVRQARLDWLIATGLLR